MKKRNLFFNLYHQLEQHEFYISHTEAVTLFSVFPHSATWFQAKKKKNKSENCTIPLNATSNFLQKEI